MHQNTFLSTSARKYEKLYLFMGRANKNTTDRTIKWYPGTVAASDEEPRKFRQPNPFRHHGSFYTKDPAFCQHSNF
jgi:hypothetical protein